jgi:hypothetical protein
MTMNEFPITAFLPKDTRNSQSHRRWLVSAGYQRFAPLDRHGVSQISTDR